MVAVNIVSADHPSLDVDLERFLTELRTEPRHFGPSARTNPKPYPSLVASLRGRGGFRIVTVERGRVIGLVRADGEGSVWIAVAADRRGWGIGAALGRAAIHRAIGLRYRRLVINSTRRSWAIRRIGERSGCVVVEHEHGRTELILDRAEQRRSA
jgi:GNAT superfamily N-acetyltransferase